MANLVPPELQGWEEIETLARRGSSTSAEEAQALANKKLVFSIANLGENVFTAQKHVSRRLDDLNQHLEKAANSSEKLAKKTFWLTIALVVATIVQAVAAVIVARKT